MPNLPQTLLCSYTLNDLKEIMESDKYDSINVHDKFFYINSKNYLKADHIRLWKIKETNLKSFRPTSHWVTGNGKMCEYTLDENEKGMFHYSLLMDPKYKIKHWETEYSHNQQKKIDWINKIYKNFDLTNQKHWAEENKRITGHYGPWLSYQTDPNGDLFVHNGKHPEFVPQGIIDESDIRIKFGF